MVITRLGPLSCAKIAGTLYTILGLIVGAVIALVSLAGGFASAALGNGPGLKMFLGVGAILVVPICYGALGFIMALIAAALYNIVAGFAGGIEIELDKGVL